MKAKAIFQDQPERVAAYDSILSGESRRKLEQFEPRRQMKLPLDGLMKPGL